MNRNSFFLLLLVSLIFYSEALAKFEGYEYRPMFTQGKTWVMEEEAQGGSFSNDLGYERSYFSHTFTLSNMQETVKLNRDCVKMLRHTIVCGPEAYGTMESLVTIPDDSYMTYWENSKTIHCDTFRPYRANNPYLWIILDFNLTTGANIRVIDYSFYEYDELERYTVGADELISVRDEIYRRLTILDADKQVCDYWVEGIGSRNSCLMTQQFGSADVEYFGAKTLAVYENGNLIFDYDDFATDNVIASVEEAEDDIKDNDPQIYDITGRRLSSIPESGLYIVNGKKFLK